MLVFLTNITENNVLLLDKYLLLIEKLIQYKMDDNLDERKKQICFYPLNERSKELGENDWTERYRIEEILASVGLSGRTISRCIITSSYFAAIIDYFETNLCNEQQNFSLQPNNQLKLTVENQACTILLTCTMSNDKMRNICAILQDINDLTREDLIFKGIQYIRLGHLGSTMRFELLYEIKLHSKQFMHKITLINQEYTQLEIIVGIQD